MEQEVIDDLMSEGGKKLVFCLKGCGRMIPLLNQNRACLRMASGSLQLSYTVRPDVLKRLLFRLI
jgi:hypothetical protein